MMRHLLTLLLLLQVLLVSGQEVSLPKVTISGISHELTYSSGHPAHGTDTLYLNGKPVVVDFNKGTAAFEAVLPAEDITITYRNESVSATVPNIPSWLSIIPPLLAIVLALLFREVLTSLFVGIFSGAAVIAIYTDGPAGFFTAFLSVIDTYILSSLYDKDHLSVILFSMLIGGMVALISRNGGMAGVVDKISRYAKSAKSGQFTTWLLGVMIFFDDYANTLVVGNTMRPVTDRLRISREKLSYLVDSTAAPVAAIAFVTTWIGAELGYIQDGIDSLSDLNESPYVVFLNSLAYSFYPIFTLAFMLMLIFTRRDFGPMRKAELRSRKTGEVSKVQGVQDQEKINEEINALSPAEGTKKHWLNAAIPVLIVIFGTIAGLIYTGYDAAVFANQELSWLKKISQTIGNSDSYRSLLWSSLGALSVALLLTVSQRIMSLGEAIESMSKGFKTMLSAVLILVLAWSLAKTTEDLHTAGFITNLLVGLELNPAWLPFATFILSAVISFSTGSSWSTMAILYPLMLPAGWMLCRSAGLDYESSLEIFHNLASCVLAGSVLGDHCSPISDTTILSSLASSCNHIDHVRTQLPYAVTVGTVAVFVGTLLSGFGVSSWITMPAGIIILFLIVRYIGKPVDNYIIPPQP